jgi:Tfp pilus assembly protein PilF
MVALRRVPYQLSIGARFLSALSVLISILGQGAYRAAAADSPEGTASAAFRAPYIPAEEGDVLQEVPSAGDPAVAAMQRLRMQFEATPRSLPAAIELARAYVDYSRQIGDAHYAGYAEAVLAPWMATPSPPAAALVWQATILQYRHQFGEARVLLQRTFAEDPRNAQGWLILATLDMVQGDYPSAAADCAQVTNQAGVEFGLACTGNLRSYIGQARQSLELLRRAESAGATVPAGFGAWIQGLIAETAERLGDWPLAEAHYRRALELQPQDNFLLVAYADFLLDRRRPREVLKLLDGHAQSDTAFLRIALAQSALQAVDAERYRWIMAARFEALRLRGSDYFGREQARFALQLQHDPLTALDLAERNWQFQRAPGDARVLLEAAQAARQPQAAAAVLDFLQRTKLEDPIIEPLAQDLRAQLKPATGGGT